MVNDVRIGEDALAAAMEQPLVSRPVRGCDCSIRNRLRKISFRERIIFATIIFLLSEKKEISVSKEETTDERLFTNLPPKLIEIAKYLWKLTYYSRPDYMLIYRMLMVSSFL